MKKSDKKYESEVLNCRIYQDFEKILTISDNLITQQLYGQVGADVKEQRKGKRRKVE